MKIILVGASGTLGSAIARELSADHEVIRASRHGQDVQVDIVDEASVQAMFKHVGPFDALVSATGWLHFGPWDQVRPQDIAASLDNKLMGQIRLALLARPFLNKGGSITLTSGIVGEQAHILDGVSAATVNQALKGFVQASAQYWREGRINLLSPTVLSESLGGYGPYFPGFEAVPAARAAKACRRSVEGVETGRILRVGYA
ncbi:short chain dehydrogenase [Alcaligenes sp. Marseille-Q7550]